MLRTLKFKLYNNNTYQTRFDRQVSICRKVYNTAKETYEYGVSSGVYLSEYDLHKQLTECKREFPYLKEVHSQTLQEVISIFRKSYDNFYRQLKDGSISKLKSKYLAKCSTNNTPINYKHLISIGKPKWAKKGIYNSIQFKSFKIVDGKIKLPNWGTLKVFNQDYLNKYEITRTRSACIKQEVDGLYVSIVVDIKPIQRSNDNQIVGIDMGVNKFCYVSNGQNFDNPLYYTNSQKELKLNQRKVSRKYIKDAKKQSNNYKKQLKVVSKIHKSITNKRNYFHWKVVNAISSDVVVREDLNIKNMSKKSKLSKFILDSSWASFLSKLETRYEVIKVNPAYTSQTCSCCGHVDKNSRLSQSVFICTKCGHTENADSNASKIIMLKAEVGSSTVECKHLD